MDIRRFFGVQTSSKSSATSAGSSKKSREKATDGKSSNNDKPKDGLKRKSSKTSDSDEKPSKENKRKTHHKKKKAIIETDSSEEEPLPKKIRKKSQDSGKKAKKQETTIVSSDEEDAIPSRLKKVQKNDKQETKQPVAKTTRMIEKTPVKVVTSVSEYFGSKPVERSTKKSQKRKERPDDVSEESSADGTSNNNVENVSGKKSCENKAFEKPAKKAKKSSLESREDTTQEKERKQIETNETALKPTTPSKTDSRQKNDSSTPSKSLSFTSVTNKKSSVKSTTPEKPRDVAKASPIIPGKKTDDTKKPTLNGRHVTPEKPKPVAKSAPSIEVTADGKKPSSSDRSADPATPKGSAKSTPGKSESNVTDVDVVPSSLERKASGYRSFMMREGPQALGSKEIPEGSESCLAGKVFVVTGVLESIERDDAVELIKKYGGKVTQAVSKKTTYLVVGRDPGMSKVEKAKQVGTRQIDEDGLFDIIRASQPKAKKTEEKAKPTNDESSQDLESSQFTDRSESQTSVYFSPSEAGHSQSSVFSSASSTPATQTPTASPLPDGVPSETLLWVDKYKPKATKYIIGQKGDKSNVNKLLRWLQHWHRNQKSGKPKAGFFAGKEDGSIFKAALLSGPPGVGKTTSAHLVCKEVGFSFVEFNASDSRSKKTLEQQISEILDNKTMDGYFGSAVSKSTSGKHALIMDEVDGMAGNEDRGGMQELINLIKSTKIPIICMCNDRNSQKVRSLANYCFDLRFHRPRIEQIKGAMMTIAFKEHLTIPPQAMEKIIVGANQDVRQVLHNLSMWTSRQKSMTYDEAKADADRAHKDIKLGPFDVTRKIFSAEESSKMSVYEQFSLFFNDYSLVPLFSQENYLQAVPYSASGDKKKILKCVSDAAESFCNSDLVEKCIRSNGSWNLLPLQGFFSCVLPGTVMRGRLGQRIDFPCWLGKNSTTTKNSRILQELVSHTQLSISGSKNELNLEYIPYLRDVLSKPLIEATTEDCSSKVSEVIEVMDSYNFLKEDWESIMEVGLFQGKPKLQTLIDSKVKAAFTRTYNKGSHVTPYSSIISAKKKAKKSSADLETGELGTGEAAPESSDSDDDIASLAQVKKSAKTGSKKSGKTPADTKARGKGTGKGKTKK